MIWGPVEHGIIGFRDLVHGQKGDLRTGGLRRRRALSNEGQYRAQDRSPVASSKICRKHLAPRGQDTLIFHERMISSFPEKLPLFTLFAVFLACRLLLKKVVWTGPYLEAETIETRLGHIYTGDVNSTNQSPLHTRGFLSNFQLVCANLNVNLRLSPLKAITGAEAGFGGRGLGGSD